MLTAEEIKKLKQQVDQEIARRNGYGAISTSGYSMSPNPSHGTVIYASQGKAVVNEILKIKDVAGLKLINEQAPNGSIPATSGHLIPNKIDQSLTTLINQLKSESMTGSSTSCRGACTGLCKGTCASSCSGCSTQCHGCSSCTGGCGSGCTNGCYGGATA